MRYRVRCSRPDNGELTADPRRSHPMSHPSLDAGLKQYDPNC